jgi:hypothetical protein
MSYFLKGSTTSMRVLSCDTVIDGAFFSQPDFQVPKEEVSQHRGQNMVIPSRVFPYLVMIHSQFCFGFLKALLYGPAKATEPNESGQPCALTGALLMKYR